MQAGPGSALWLLIGCCQSQSRSPGGNSPLMPGYFVAKREKRERALDLGNIARAAAASPSPARHLDTSDICLGNCSALVLLATGSRQTLLRLRFSNPGLPPLNIQHLPRVIFIGDTAERCNMILGFELALFFAVSLQTELFSLCKPTHLSL